MFEYAIKILRKERYEVQIKWENETSAIYSKPLKNQYDELSAAIKLLQKESDDTENKILEILENEGEK